MLPSSFTGCKNSLTLAFIGSISMAFSGSVVLEEDRNNYLGPTFKNFFSISLVSCPSLSLSDSYWHLVVQQDFCRKKANSLLVKTGISQKADPAGPGLQRVKRTGVYRSDGVTRQQVTCCSQLSSTSLLPNGVWSAGWFRDNNNKNCVYSLFFSLPTNQLNKSTPPQIQDWCWNCRCTMVEAVKNTDFFFFKGKDGCGAPVFQACFKEGLQLKGQEKKKGEKMKENAI